VHTLTNRQREIVRLIADGLPTKGIAARLGLTESAVKWHVRRLLGRFGAESRAHLIAILLESEAEARWNEEGRARPER
jgi:two-component system nitrate/nitrite response regulator NarL